MVDISKHKSPASHRDASSSRAILEEGPLAQLSAFDAAVHAKPILSTKNKEAPAFKSLIPDSLDGINIKDDLDIDGPSPSVKAAENDVESHRPDHEHEHEQDEINQDAFYESGVLTGSVSPIQQLKILTHAHLKEYYRTSPCMVFMFAVLAFWFFSLMIYLPPTEIAEFDLDRVLARPVYPSFRWNPKRENWLYTNKVMEEHQLRFEGFFQYLNFSNTQRLTQNKTTVNSFATKWDFVGP